jgi:hypothetical protein
MQYKRKIRTDLMSKLHFSKSFEVGRNKIDKLIAEGRLPVECIDGIDYINISNREGIVEALRPVEYIY